MSTIVYTDYYKAYDKKKFDINNVNFQAYLVSEDYKPNKDHKPKDIEPFIVSDAGSLSGNIIASKGMGEIVEHLQQGAENELGIVKNIEIEDKKVKGGIIAKGPISTIDYDKREIVKSKLDSVIKDVNKREVLKEKIERLEEHEKAMLWHDLYDNGLKYLVVGSKQLEILCFCEETK